MNNRTTLKTLTAFALAFALLAFHSCRKVTSVAVSHIEANDVDSLIYEQVGIDNDKAFVIIDSLLLNKSISYARASYYRAYIHHKIKHMLNAELQYKRALADGELLREQPTAAYYAYDQLATILNTKGDIQGALTYATRGYALASEDESDEGLRYQAVLLHDIGYGQMMLGHTEDAEHNFNKAYSTMESLVNKSESYMNLYAWARVSYNIMDAYVCANLFEEAVPWVEAAERAIRALVARPDCPEAIASEYVGCLCTHKAIVMRKIGRLSEAENAYRAFLLSDYAKTDVGLVDHAYYLDIVERWKDRADLTPRLDSLIKAWKIPKSVYYLKTYLAPFYNAYMRSGQTDKALAIGQRIVEEMDSIDEYERNHNAAELSIIYETQQKEAQISKQHSHLVRLRFIIVAVILLLITIFLFIYNITNRISAKKLQRANTMLEASYNELELKNEQLKKTNSALEEANARAEVSSRMKTEFIRQISHEIRTPLNILSGFTQVITSSGMELDEETCKDIKHQIMENTSRITGLVNKMLEISDASSKTVIERTDQIPAMLIAVEAAEASGAVSAAVNFDMRVAPEAEDVLLTTNRKAASRALELMLDNAIKFSRQQHTEDSSVSTDQPNISLAVNIIGQNVAFIVEDDGPGIPAEEAEHIFEEFVQLNSYSDGTGIGLTVARSFARRLGGDITLDTTFREGARFIMTLPVA